MIRIHETTCTIPFFRPVPLTNLPLIYQREHLFPYASYGDTESTPVPRAFRMVVLENDLHRVEVAPELASFADGLKQDYKAVRAAFELDWSNGQVEGQVNRLKLIKRQMYGRAGFELLRTRVLKKA